MNEAKLASVPMWIHSKLSNALSPKTNEERKEMSKVPYANDVGSSMFDMICTCSDIANAVSFVNKFIADSSKTHYLAIKWVMRYIKWAIDIGLVYERCLENDSMIKGFIDVDYASDSVCFHSFRKYG